MEEPVADAAPPGADDPPPGDDAATAPTAGPAVPAGPHTGPPSAAARNVVIGVLIGMVIANYAGGLLTSVLVNDHPAWLISLNAQNRTLALASGELGAPAFYLIGFVRLLAPDPFFFLLGRWYGDSAIRWMERKAPSYGELLRMLERGFHKAQLFVVAFAPNNPVCLFAGAAGMGWGAFMAANVIGTIARLVLIRFFSGVFEGPLGSLRNFIGAYRWPLLALSAVLLVLSIWSDRRAGRTSVGDLAHMDEDIAAAETGPGEDA